MDSVPLLRRYVDLYTVMTDAISRYVSDVKNCDFPQREGTILKQYMAVKLWTVHFMRICVANLLLFISLYILFPVLSVEMADNLLGYR